MLALGVTVAAVAEPAASPRVTQAAGWLSEVVASGFGVPTGFALAPDGRIFITEKAGAVRVHKNGALLPTPFAQFPVNTYGERGLEGVVLDPNFSVNSYAYFHYTYEHNAAEPAGPKTNRIVRVTVNGDVMAPGSEVVLVGTVAGTIAQPSCNDHPAGTDCIPADERFHSAGGLHFGADGKLYASLGDAALFGSANALRAQSIDSLAGKLIRVNPDGTAPADNPFYDGNPNANRSKVWVYGLRNPYRFGLQPVTDTPFIGDVGADWWEEINQGLPGRNFGWPCYEGTQQRKSYDTEPLCLALYAAGTATPPFWAQAHDPAGSAVIGGAFNTGSQYPPEYANAYFFGDAASGVVQVMTFNPTAVATILPGAGSPVQFQRGADGFIYFLSYSSRQVRRLRFDQSNVPPVAVIAASPSAGALPLNVQFSSAGSFDPDNQPIAFFWNFGDGSPPSLQANPMHTYTEAGTHTATLMVIDSLGAVGVATMPITAGNGLPLATITSPGNGRVYTANEAIVFSGAGVDVEDGALPGSALLWEITLVHCFDGGACHRHPYLTHTGAAGVLVAPDHGVTGNEFYYLEVKLTAADSAGLRGTATRFIGPDVNGDTCMDAFLPTAASIPPFLVGVTSHAASGSAQTDHHEVTDVSGAPAPSSANWVRTASSGGEQGSGYSLSILLGQFNVTSQGVYGVSFDTDVFADLKLASTAGQAWSEVQAFGAIVSPSGGIVGEIVPLFREYAYKLPVGSKPPLAVARTGKPLSLALDLALGQYYTALVVITDTFSDNAVGASGDEVGEVWAVTLTRQTAVCSVRLSGLGGAASPASKPRTSSMATALELPAALEEHRESVMQQALGALLNGLPPAP